MQEEVHHFGGWEGACRGAPKSWIKMSWTSFGKIPTPIKIKLAIPPPPLKKPTPPPPPPKTRNFMGMGPATGVFQQKEPKMPGAHKIGAAVSGPRIAGGNFTDMRLFLKIGVSYFSGWDMSSCLPYFVMSRCRRLSGKCEAKTWTQRRLSAGLALPMLLLQPIVCLPKKRVQWIRRPPSQNDTSGKSKWGLSNGGLRPLSAICAQSSRVMHFCGPFGPLSKGNFRRKTTTIVGNRGQLWTSTLSPHLLSPYLDFPKHCHEKAPIPQRNSARIIQKMPRNVPENVEALFAYLKISGTSSKCFTANFKHKENLSHRHKSAGIATPTMDLSM